MKAVEQVAASLIRSWQEGVRQPLTGLHLATQAEAYEVQQRVAQAMGWLADAPARAWKLGGAPHGLISAARVPDVDIKPSGWHLPAGYCQGAGIEGELFVRLGRDLDEHTDLAAAYAAIDEWLPGIELCDTRWIRGDQADPLLRLADRQLNRALIVGQAHGQGRPPDWASQRVELWVGEQRVFSGNNSHPFAEPLNSLPWLARHAAAQGYPLRAGDLVATGSWTGLYWAPFGVRVEVRFPGVGVATLYT